jgi:uncharacterized protein (DUF1015 family)
MAGLPRRGRRGAGGSNQVKAGQTDLKQLPFSPSLIIVRFFMAQIKPFAALRPRPDWAAEICELPYDVMSSAEARNLAGDNPRSFLHVSKPEIDLPATVDIYDTQVYAKGRENFKHLQVTGALRQDPQPCFYLYRQTMGRHSQTGLVAVASCQDYRVGIIKKHEFTRPDKEDDRVRHMEALNSQTGPVLLFHRATKELNAFTTHRASLTPDIDFTAKDGIRHSSWTLRDPTDIQFVTNAFEQIPFLYIADGHHRSAAAARVDQVRGGSGESAFFLSVIFPHDQMQILPYHRVLKDLNGLTPAQLLKQLEATFVITPGGPPQPGATHELGFYLDGSWRTLRFRPEISTAREPVERLDVSLLQKLVLAPIFGIDDPRTSKRIQFVGGIRGTPELEKLVNSSEYACAFAMFPTRVDDLMAIADAGGVMPPKSTWFEPKLRDAMFCHML